MLSAWDVFFIAVGQIIGAGVIALTGIAIGMTGPAVIFAYLAAAVLVLIVTLLIMMAGTVLPATGAYYVWTSRLSGGWLGSIVLLLILLASVSLSLYGSSFGLYLNPLFPVLSANSWGVVVIALLFLANLFGLRMAAKVQVALVLAPSVGPSAVRWICCAKSANRVVVAMVACRCCWLCDGCVLAQVRHGWCLYDRWAQ